MALHISETEVLAKFDRLVQKGELHYSPPQRIYVTEGPFQVRSTSLPLLLQDPPASRA